MGGRHQLYDSQLWLDEALAVVRDQDTALRAIADSVALSLASTSTERDANELSEVRARIDAALNRNLAVARSLVPQRRSGTAAPAAEGYLAALEEERYRLAREVHDGPAQVLANAVLELQYCQRLLVKDPSALDAELAGLQSLLQDGLVEVRRLIFELHPPALVEMGLEASLSRLADDFRERTGLQVEVGLADQTKRLPASHEAAAFRIVQEALQNARRHSRCTRVEIRSTAEAEFWRVCVVDNGIGFDTEREHNGRRTLGLVAMSERAVSIGASLEIASAPGKGTSVTLTVPRGGGKA